jgi:phosphatidylglycerophosphate synthase
MESANYEVTDRRPIAARRLGWINHLAAALASMHVSANSISVAGMICGILAGICLDFTAFTGSIEQRLLWISAAALVQLRLMANLLDGMVAIASRTASQVGELFNDAPDRVSDSVTLIGLGYAAGGSPALGWCAALLAMFTAYIRLLGKASGTGSDFRGPMAKQHRMFLVTILCLVSAIAPVVAQYRAPQWCLVIVCAGCVVTGIRRFRGFALVLRSKV